MYICTRMLVSIQHTWVCPVCSLDQRAAWLMIVLGDCSSDPALSGVRGLNSELKPETTASSVTIQPDNLQIHHTQLYITSDIKTDKVQPSSPYDCQHDDFYLLWISIHPYSNHNHPYLHTDLTSTLFLTVDKNNWTKIYCHLMCLFL